jgi:hypothetical protein
MADSLADAIIGGVESVTATWAKQRKAEERHASAIRNRRDAMTRACGSRSKRRPGRAWKPPT